jgi:hypothetical protein
LKKRHFLQAAAELAEAEVEAEVKADVTMEDGDAAAGAAAVRPAALPEPAPAPVAMMADEDSDDETFDDLRIRSPPVRQKTASFFGAISLEKISFATTGSGQAQGKLKKRGVFRRLSSRQGWPKRQAAIRHRRAAWVASALACRLAPRWPLQGLLLPMRSSNTRQ